MNNSASQDTIEWLTEEPGLPRFDPQQAPPNSQDTSLAQKCIVCHQTSARASVQASTSRDSDDEPSSTPAQAMSIGETGIVSVCTESVSHPS
jgi:hypothetical protein